MTTPTTVSVRLQLRADTAANWTSANPTLLANELGRETDTGKIKIGNGSTAWSSLAYQAWATLPIAVASGGTGQTSYTNGQLLIGNTTGNTLTKATLTAGSGIAITNGTGSITVAASGISDAQIAADAEIAVSKLADGTARQLLQTDAAGTGVEWASNIDIPGTLDVTSTATFDSIASHPLGAAATPSITFTGDTNTGIYSPGADQVSVATGGTERLRIDSTGQIESVSLGTAAAPTYSFTTDPNTGIYSPGADQLAISTNGTGRLFVNSSGSVGIGTSTVGSSGNANITIAGANNSGIQFGRTNATAGGGLLTSASGPGIAFYSYTGAVGSETYTEAMRIDSSNRVGIGTTSSSAKLHVTGALDGDDVIRADVNSSNGLIILRPDGANGNQIRFGGNGANANILRFVSGGDAERARIDSSGRLLVGTSTAYSDYIGADSGFTGIGGFVRNTGDGVAQFQNWASGIGLDTVGGASLFISRCKSGTVGVHTGGALASGNPIGRIVFNASDGTNFRSSAYITAEVDGGVSTADVPGRLVFSTTKDGGSSPLARLRIANTGAMSTSSSGNGIVYSVTAGAGTATFFIAGNYSGTEGSEGSGTTSFYVWSNGNVQNTNNSYTAISDIKLKENIVDANSQWDDIKALQVRNYNLKEGQTHKQIGLIAQEVEPISPGLVYESPDRDAEGNDLGTVTKSVNYSVLYMKAVKALQEAMERIETLEASNADLLARVSALESA